MSKKLFRSSEASEVLINKQNIHYGHNILQKSCIGFRIKFRLLTSDREKKLQTMKASEDHISKQTYNNSNKELQKISLNSDNSCFKYEYNLLVGDRYISPRKIPPGRFPPEGSTPVVSPRNIPPNEAWLCKICR